MRAAGTAGEPRAQRFEMLKDIVVDVDPRPSTGKNESRRVRAAGRVPGIVYGGGRGSVPITADPRRLLEILRSDTGENTIFTLQLGGSEAKRVVMIRDYQRDPVKGKLLHVDFVRIDLEKEIEVKVPVHVSGIPAGVKNAWFSTCSQPSISASSAAASVPGTTGRRAPGSRRCVAGDRG